MPHKKTFRDLALEFHRRLPDRIRTYLHNIGLPDAVICRYLLGWNGDRITIPITNKDRQIAFFKLAKDPEGKDSPYMLSWPEGSIELYGWERIPDNHERLVICDGEFERLVLEAQGFPTVTSTGDAGTFLPEWAEAFEEIPKIYICFRNSAFGDDATGSVAALIPRARIVYLPEEVGYSGGVAEFFLRLDKGREEFEQLLDIAQPLVPTSIRLSSNDAHDE